MLKGETPEEVAASLGVSPHRLMRWESTFMDGGERALADSSEHRTGYQKFKEKLPDVLQWAALLVVLALTILALTRFLNQPSS